MDILFGHFPKRSIWNIHTLETSSPPTKLKRLGFWKNLPVLDSKRCSFRFGKLCRRKKGGIVWRTAVQRQRLGVLWPDSKNYAQALGDVAPRPRLSDHARTFPTVLDDTAMQQPAYLFCLYCWAYPDVNKKDHLSLKTCAGPAIRSDNLRKHNEDECHKTCKAKWDKDHGTNTTSAQQAMFGPTVALARLVRTIIAAVFVCGSSIGSLVKRLVNLQRVNGVLIPDCYTSATADTEQGGIHSFLDAATQLLLCLQSTAMRQGLMFSVMGDGSTNVAHRELEAVAVRYPFDIRGRVLALKTRGLNGVRVKNEFFGIFPVDVSASRDLKSFDSQALLYGYDKLFVERGLGSWDEDEPGPGDADVLVRTAALPYVPVPGVSGLRSVAHSEASTAPESAPNLEASRTRVLPLAPGWHLV